MILIGCIVLGIMTAEVLSWIIENYAALRDIVTGKAFRQD